MRARRSAQLAKRTICLGAAVLPHLPLLRALARVRTGDAAAADDLVHETLVRAAFRYAAAADPARRRAWLLAAQRDIHAISMKRRCNPTGASDSRKQAARRPDLQAALLQLGDSVREALFLSDGAGLSDEELAAALDCSPNVARRRVSCGRSLLMDLLGEQKISTQDGLDFASARAANRRKPRAVEQAKRLSTTTGPAAKAKTHLSYISRLNLRLFEKLLDQTFDQKKRRALETLIRQEIDKQHAYLK